MQIPRKLSLFEQFASFDTSFEWSKASETFKRGIEIRERLNNSEWSLTDSENLQSYTVAVMSSKMASLVSMTVSNTGKGINIAMRPIEETTLDRKGGHESWLSHPFQHYSRNFQWLPC
jgi:hypothetical protein